LRWFPSGNIAARYARPPPTGGDGPVSNARATRKSGAWRKVTFDFAGYLLDPKYRRPAKFARRSAKSAALPARSAERGAWFSRWKGYFCRGRQKAPAEGA
jgi:hypothetical protein